ncbi:MAG: hypothetical protein E5V95_33150 [Mesorhizobium sp.]|uniref:hypothetical protein n=1 Tax=Mesorhizobium sp. TaxID=1871066 RepID=UPI001228B253|nr:hypothetical protein [Mesorhizobium sp.]TIV13717.1 MAG: hypothetical protein E5V95_33150 [Mesorhizobium sp.]
MERTIRFAAQRITSVVPMSMRSARAIALVARLIVVDCLLSRMQRLRGHSPQRRLPNWWLRIQDRQLVVIMNVVGK